MYNQSDYVGFFTIDIKAIFRTTVVICLPYWVGSLLLLIRSIYNRNKFERRLSKASDTKTLKDYISTEICKTGFTHHLSPEIYLFDFIVLRQGYSYPHSNKENKITSFLPTRIYVK